MRHRRKPRGHLHPTRHQSSPCCGRKPRETEKPVRLTEMGPTSTDSGTFGMPEKAGEGERSAGTPSPTRKWALRQRSSHPQGAIGPQPRALRTHVPLRQAVLTWRLQGPRLLYTVCERHSKAPHSHPAAGSREGSGVSPSWDRSSGDPRRGEAVSDPRGGPRTARASEAAGLSAPSPAAGRKPRRAARFGSLWQVQGSVPA